MTWVVGEYGWTQNTNTKCQNPERESAKGRSINHYRDVVSMKVHNAEGKSTIQTL